MKLIFKHGFSKKKNDIWFYMFFLSFFLLYVLQMLAANEQSTGNYNIFIILHFYWIVKNFSQINTS